MARKTAAVTVGTTPTRLTTLDVKAGFVSATFYNAGSVDVWVGSSTVAVGAGIKLAAGANGNEARLDPFSPLYAVVASGTCQVNVDEMGPI